MLRTLRRAVNQQTRFVSSNRRLGEFSTRRRTSRETILLFRKIEGFLKYAPLAETEKIVGYINIELDNTLPKVRSPQYVYERVISLLISRRYAPEAALLYQRMHEEAGLMSSNVLDAKMLAIALSLTHDEPPEPLLLRIAPIFLDRHYTENDFSGLLRTMAKYGVDNEHICALVELFISSRRPNYIVLNFLRLFSVLALVLEMLT